MSDGLTTIPFLVEGRVAVVRDVPAELCGDCGEAYMKGSAVDRIEAVLDKLEELHAEVSVVHYEAA
jgi:YgiT-type zinc finger domain-containing protein